MIGAEIPGIAQCIGPNPLIGIIICRGRAIVEATFHILGVGAANVAPTLTDTVDPQTCFDGQVWNDVHLGGAEVSIDVPLTQLTSIGH